MVYRAFSGFSKPEYCTNHADFEDAEFNAILCAATRRSLTMDEIGHVGWTPLHSMNPEALAYFMPRLIELAVTGAVDRDGEPFWGLFVNMFHQDPHDKRYGLFGDEQREAMAAAFNFLIDTYKDQLALEGWLDEARHAAVNWVPFES